jgi:pyruvate/2-oxoglutarate dehydrogenase complex dihydrolipoamide dehydrogenase (E3) component
MNIHGVNLILNDGLKEFRQNGRELLLTSGKTLQTDMTILSIGVLPENTLAKVAGLELGYKGASKVNQQLQTSQPDIYAIGDAIEVIDLVSSADPYPLHGQPIVKEDWLLISSTVVMQDISVHREQLLLKCLN